ncbi:hypothetical protein LX97_02401 [Nonlabens dokdonensis]|nr:hypothetical protein [Nonlabens dokdonensis]PZX39035.1 hypothetical protein LX97_02401 [Nonlabens dokdonensis]
MRTCIENHNLGEYDGHEMAMDQSDGSIYMYSKDAVALFNGVQTILRKKDFLKDAEVIIRTDNNHVNRIIL